MNASTLIPPPGDPVPAAPAPQTANQVNLPQTGQVEPVKTPPPAAVKEEPAAPAAVAPPNPPAKAPVGLMKKNVVLTPKALPAGWFSIKGTKQMKDAVAQTVGAHPTMAAPVKAWIKSEINGPDLAGAQAVRLDAHRFVTKDEKTGAVKVVVQFTLSSVF